MRDAIDERLGPLLPALQALLVQQGLSLDDLGRPLPQLACETRQV